MRKKIDFRRMDLDEILVIMSEGNPGASSVLTGLASKHYPSLVLHLSVLDDMNIRGTQIWVGYSDYCDRDLARFSAAVLTRDQGMVECINKEGRMGNHTEVAVSWKTCVGRWF